MSAILDDLKAGDHVTVLEWKPRDVPVFADNSWLEVGTRTAHDTSWVGDVLEVVAVDLPFVAARNRLSRLSDVIRLDVRRLTLRKLSAAYVDAILSDPRFTPRAV